MCATHPFVLRPPAEGASFVTPARAHDGGSPRLLGHLGDASPVPRLRLLVRPSADANALDGSAARGHSCASCVDRFLLLCVVRSARLLRHLDRHSQMPRPRLLVRPVRPRPRRFSSAGALPCALDHQVLPRCGRIASAPSLWRHLVLDGSRCHAPGCQPSSSGGQRGGIPVSREAPPSAVGAASDRQWVRIP